MTLRDFQPWLVKRLLPPSTRELIFDGGLQIVTPGDHGRPVFSTLLQWDGDAITQFDLDAADGVANLRSTAEKHMRAVELQLRTLLQPLRRLERMAAAGAGFAWAGSVTVGQEVLEWRGIAQAPAPDPFGFVEWSWIIVAVSLIPLAQRLWSRVRRYAVRFALCRLVTYAGI